MTEAPAWADKNRIEIQGRLARDAEVRHTTGGHQFVSLTIPTSERWKDRASGEWKEKVQWHRVSVGFNDVALNTAVDLQKGQKVRVIGKMTYREYESNGEKRTSAEIEVHRGGEIHIVPDDRDAQPARTTRPAQARQAAPPPRDDLDDEIPF